VPRGDLPDESGFRRGEDDARLTPRSGATLAGAERSLSVSIAADQLEPFTPARPLSGVRAEEFAGLPLVQRLQ
jgi:hypothetical protein